MTGTFFAVVGPSGAGKDTLIDIARSKLADRDDVRFVRRTITRPSAAGGEDHEAVDEETFSRLLADGGFVLAWAAHGLRYGIRKEIAADVDAGACAVANLSRGVLGDAAASFASLHVLHVTAPPQILAKRLAERGRETADDAAKRLARARYEFNTDAPVSTIMNDGSPESAGEAFVQAILAVHR